jgi:MscS family membrane protein
LAVRPTLENLIGGFILYLDKPVQVGDFCSFGDKTATVEAIGVRSTQLRALDRTLISVPNAQFADMEIVNWAQCDEMLIDETIGLRYETTPDQLRFILAKLRELAHAHPRINSNSVRVRFWGYGDSSLNVNIRIYAKTREWNDFFAIREDVLLRMADVVAEAGSGFAFPSSTVYMGRDQGLDPEKSDAAEGRVRNWRLAGKLPFPRIPPEYIAALEDTLDYPPRGSPDANSQDFDVSVDAERLSAESPTDDEEDGPDPADEAPDDRRD